MDAIESSVGSFHPTSKASSIKYPNWWKVGLKFNPTDHEVITCYLIPKKQNPEDNSANDLISTVNVYSSNPEALCDKGICVGDAYYFFTERNYTNGNRPSRSAGNGFWKAISKSIDIKDNSNNEIGKKRVLDYYEGTYRQRTRTGWKMIEYCLQDSHTPLKKTKKNSTIRQNNEKGNADRPPKMLEETVICKIYRTTESDESRKQKKQSSQRKSNDGDGDGEKISVDKVNNVKKEDENYSCTGKGIEKMLDNDGADGIGQTLDGVPLPPTKKQKQTSEQYDGGSTDATGSTEQYDGGSTDAHLTDCSNTNLLTSNNLDAFKRWIEIKKYLLEEPEDQITTDYDIELLQPWARCLSPLPQDSATVEMVLTAHYTTYLN